MLLRPQLASLTACAIGEQWPKQDSCFGCQTRKAVFRQLLSSDTGMQAICPSSPTISLCWTQLDHGGHLPAGNPVTAFMPRKCSAASYSTFLQRIQQASAAGRFHKNPIGPIGANLSLQDEKWALAVEVAIGSACNTFVVHDFADQATLKVSIAPLPSAAKCWHHSFHWCHRDNCLSPS